MNKSIVAYKDKETSGKAYSQECEKIQSEAKNWPAWKVDTYNTKYATSTHAKQIVLSSNKQR